MSIGSSVLVQHTVVANRQTDYATSAAIGRIFALTACMRYGLKPSRRDVVVRQTVRR